MRNGIDDVPQNMTESFLVLKFFIFYMKCQNVSFETGDHAELIVQPPSIDLGPDEADKEAVKQRRDSTESKKSEVRQ